MSGIDMQKPAVLSLLGLITVASAGGWFIGSRWQSDSQRRALSKTLTAAIERNEGAAVDLAKVFPFRWDRVHVFPPYFDGVIERDLGFAWPEIDQTRIGSYDDVNLVVFVQGDEVVRWFEHLRHQELGELRRPRGFTRNEAVFRVGRTEDDSRPMLIPPISP